MPVDASVRLGVAVGRGVVRTTAFGAETTVFLRAAVGFGVGLGVGFGVAVGDGLGVGLGLAVTSAVGDGVAARAAIDGVGGPGGRRQGGCRGLDRSRRDGRPDEDDAEGQGHDGQDEAARSVAHGASTVGSCRPPAQHVFAGSGRWRVLRVTPGSRSGSGPLCVPAVGPTRPVSRISARAASRSASTAIDIAASVTRHRQRAPAAPSEALRSPGCRARRPSGASSDAPRCRPCGRRRRALQPIASAPCQVRALLGDTKPHDPPRERSGCRRARRRRARHHRLARQAARLRLPLERDLRRHQRRVGLRSARRRAQEQREAGLVALDGPGAGRHRRARRRDPDASAGVGHVRARRLVQRPAGRVPDRPQALPARRAARDREPHRDRPGRTRPSSNGSACAARTTAARCPRRAGSTSCSRRSWARSRTRRRSSTCARRRPRARTSTSRTSSSRRARSCRSGSPRSASRSATRSAPATSSSGCASSSRWRCSTSSGRRRPPPRRSRSGCRSDGPGTSATA